MKKILSLLILISLMVSVKGQYLNRQPIGSVNTENYAVGSYGTSVGFRFINSFPDTGSANSYAAVNIKAIPGFIIRVVSDLYMRNNAATQWDKINGGGSGSGTVTSFSAGNLSPLFTTSVATATTTPALSFNLNNSLGGTVFGNVSSSTTQPAFTSVPVLGIAGSTLGTIGLAGNTSGIVTIKPQAAAGTYNFNLPTTAGSSGQFLTSAGGVGSPMTWTTPSSVVPALTATQLAYGDGSNLMTSSANLAWNQSNKTLILAAGGDQGPSMTIDNGIESNYIEFSRTPYQVKTSVGMLGAPELNLSFNMDYYDGVHRYYDATQAATWMALFNGGYQFQYAPSGSTPDIWNNTGRKLFSYHTYGHLIINTDATSVTGTFNAGLTVPRDVGAGNIAGIDTMVIEAAQATGTAGPVYLNRYNTGNVILAAGGGAVTMPTPFTLGATSVTTTGTQLNYLNAATGTTGTTSTNLVFSTSPTLVTPALGTPTALVGTNITGTAAAFNINGTVGATTPAAGTFTTLSASTSIALTGSAATATLGGGATAAELRFLEPSGSGSNYSAFKAVAQSADITYSLPPTVGAAGTVLTDAAGNGVLSWASAGGGSQTPWTSNINADGFTLYGNDGANEDLTLEGTSHATKTTSYVIIQPTAGNVGIGTTTPATGLDLVGQFSYGTGTAGASRQTLYNELSTSTNANTTLYPVAAGANVAASFAPTPKGTGGSSTYKSALGIFTTDHVADATNYELCVLVGTGTNHVLMSEKGGTGTIRPIILDAGVNVTAHSTNADNAKQLFLATNGTIGLNVQTPLAGLHDAYAPIASKPALLLSGATYAAGDATTTKPTLLIEPTGTTSTAWSPAGTPFGVNAGSGFAGRLMDLQVAGTSKMIVTSTGSVGIGTVSPTYNFHVLNSSVDFVGGTFTNNGATGSFPNFNFGQAGSTAFGISSWVNSAVFEASSVGGGAFGAYAGDLKLYANTGRTVDIYLKNGTGQFGIGTGSTVSARLHVISTAEQQRTGYDASNYYSTTVGSTGGVTFNAVGAGSGFTFSDPITNTSAALTTPAFTGVPTGTITSGTYTPTLTNVTNIAASTAYECQYLRVGNTVTVSGKVDMDVTIGAASELGMSLPIASAMTAEENLGGTASSPAAASLVSAVRADATNDRAAFVFTAISLTNDSYWFEFTYQIK